MAPPHADTVATADAATTDSSSSSMSGDNQQQHVDSPQQHVRSMQSQQDDELLDAMRVSFKHAESFPEDEEHYVSEDGNVVVAPVDDKARVRKYRRLLADRNAELHKAGELGLLLMDSNEELQVELEALKIQHETETRANEVEIATLKRRHDHALLEVESWKRRFARVEEDKRTLGDDFERFAAQCTCRTAAGANDRSVDRVGELTHQVAELELTVDQLKASEQASAATIAQLRAWKRAAETEQKESLALEAVEAQRERAAAEKLASDHAKLLQRAALERAETQRLHAVADAHALELRNATRETQRLLDELAELRLECSSKTEQLLTAEARSSRLQRELALLEDVSYLSHAVIDHDPEDDDDSDCSDSQQRHSSVASMRESLSRADSLMPSPFAAFPSTARAANGAPAVVTPSDLASHRKLHHYFHLSAQSIIHENKLHDKCFRSSSRFTLDSWYREVIARDVPYLEWHAWLIDRISHVAASVADDDDDTDDTSKHTTPDATRHPRSRGGGGFFLRRDADTSSSVGVASPASAASSASPSHRARHVPFSVARAFFRLLRGRQAVREPDSSSEE